jgi:cation/acetate symporter
VVASMLVGTVSTLLLIWLSPTIQIDVLKNATAWFGLRNPALITIPLSFAVGFVVSLLTKDAEALAGYAKVERQIHMGHAP